MTDPLVRLYGGGRGMDVDIRLAHENRQFEHERVRFVLRRFKLDSFGHELLTMGGESKANQWLRFSAFNSMFPSFPFVLGIHRLRNLPLPGSAKTTSSDYSVHTDPNCVEPARFRKFTWCPFVVAYDELYETLAENVASAGLHLGLVFPRSGLKEGMVIHNDASEHFWTRGLCWVYKDEALDRKLYVQPFSDLIDAIHAGGHGWRP